MNYIMHILTRSPPLLLSSPYHLTGLSSSTTSRIDIDLKTAVVAALPTANTHASKQLSLIELACRPSDAGLVWQWEEVS